ncbi:ABC transporter substrate-binding protein [Candidatus Bipolaricaulota bacterium]|nr:ABC transporter substrate-binding protein [Candidatus Bipolaricaulota bacterium]
MQKKVLTVLILLALLVIPALAQQYPVTVVDDRGVAVTIEARPTRVITIGALYAEIAVALGGLDRLIAVAVSANNPPETADLPTVGTSFAPSVEVIVAMEPDLVLGATDWGGERGNLEAAGITVITTPFIAGVPCVFLTIRTVGIALGLEDQAERLIGDIAEKIVTIESRLLAQARVRAAFLYAADPEAPPFAIGSGAIENELILRAGGENVFYDLQWGAQVSFEEIIARNPVVIFTDPAHVENITGNPLLQGVSAVKHGRVYGITAAWITSTRVGEALELIGRFLHPEG